MRGTLAWNIGDSQLWFEVRDPVPLKGVHHLFDGLTRSG